VAASDWQELGIAPTSDRAGIRRAYAMRLKALGPDRDPAAFQRLRTAYENALREADGTAEPRPKPPADRFSGEYAADPAADQARAAISAGLDRGDAAAAFAAFESAEREGLLALADLEGNEERLLAAVSADRKLPPEQLSRIVRRFQWDNSVHPLRRKRVSFAALDARLDAERWYGELVERARRARGIYESDDRLSARQLLSGPPSWWQRQMFPNRSPWLWRDLIAFGRHSEWVGSRFDPDRIAWCRGRPANRQAQRAAIVIWIGLGLFVLLGSAQGPGGLLVFVFIVLTWLFVFLVRHNRSGGRR
jgi:hypothetical protein